MVASLVSLRMRSASTKWSTAAPEIARLVSSFEYDCIPTPKGNNYFHHDEDAATQKRFQRDVHAFVSKVREYSNPFEDRSTHMETIVTMQILPEPVADCVREIKGKGVEQFYDFVSTRLLTCEVKVSDPLKRNTSSVQDQQEASEQSSIKTCHC